MLEFSGFQDWQFILHNQSNSCVRMRNHPAACPAGSISGPTLCLVLRHGSLKLRANQHPAGRSALLKYIYRMQDNKKLLKSCKCHIPQTLTPSKLCNITDQKFVYFLSCDHSTRFTDEPLQTLREKRNLLALPIETSLPPFNHEKLLTPNWPLTLFLTALWMKAWWS